jgi:hypothetical protein
MALDLAFVNLVTRHLNRDPSDINKGREVLSLGYPDLLFKTSCLNHLATKFNLDDIPLHPQSDYILQWHGAVDCAPVLDAHVFFSRLGLSLVVSDFKKHRGDEIIIDLNVNVSEEMYSRFDGVIDSGTLEHLFFPSTGFLNVFRMLRSGGIYFHAAPVTRINHGFWSFNPVFYKDFCAVNDVEILEAYLIGRNGKGDSQKFEVPWNGRGNFPNGLAIVVVLRKGKDYCETIPIQSKYL